MVTIHCLNCDADLRVSAMAEAGDLITCQDCDAVFEVVAINPVEIDFADEEEIDGDLLTIEVDDEKAASDDASDDDAEVAWADRLDRCQQVKA